MKLVRDYIPEIIRSGGRDPIYYISAADEYKKFLTAKLLEESAELGEANTVEEITEELADIMELLYAHMDLYDISYADLTKVRLKKRRESGGFKDGIVLVDIVNERPE